jgi:hypothetical protein
MRVETVAAQHDPPIAIGVIDAELAGSRAWRYTLNIEGHARELDAELAETLILTPGDNVPRRLGDTLDRTDAGVVIAPSVRHLHGCEAVVTARAELHVIGRARIYPRGHKWT